MPPSVEPAASNAGAEALVPEKLLADGEEVILAVKPSGCFVLLASVPVLLLIATAGAIAYVADEFFKVAVPLRTVGWLCLGAACLRMLAACFQWMGRLYVLTNRRAMRIQGLHRLQVFQLPLRQVRQTHLTASSGESVMGLGSLLFECEQDDAGDAWTHLSHPQEVERIVNETIRQAR